MKSEKAKDAPRIIHCKKKGMKALKLHLRFSMLQEWGNFIDYGAEYIPVLCRY